MERKFTIFTVNTRRGKTISVYRIWNLDRNNPWGTNIDIPITLDLDSTTDKHHNIHLCDQVVHAIHHHFLEIREIPPNGWKINNGDANFVILPSTCSTVSIQYRKFPSAERVFFKFDRQDMKLVCQAGIIAEMVRKIPTMSNEQWMDICYNLHIHLSTILSNSKIEDHLHSIGVYLGRSVIPFTLTFGKTKDYYNNAMKHMLYNLFAYK